MPTEDDFGPEDPLPLFLSGHADENEQQGSLLLLNAGILVMTAALVPRPSDYDGLILSQSRMGRSSGATRIWMLRATPG